MIFKKSILLFLLIIASSAVAIGLAYTTKPKKGMKYYGNYDNYKSYWEKIDALEKKGLTKEAFAILAEIYTKAKKENNAPQIVKTVIYKLKYTQFTEDFSQEKNIEELKKEIEASPFPTNAILHSLLADAYWQYYQNNRWQFNNRSTTVQFKNNDVATWDLKAIANAAIKHHKAALENQQELIGITLNEFDAIIIKGTNVARQYRPTLYHFLAHRALEFFKSSEVDVTKAADQFSLNDERFLKPYTVFSKLKLDKPSDSLETKFYALELYQQLYNLNSKLKDTEALIDLELKRIAFTYANSNNEIKDSIYLNTLSTLEKDFSSSKRVAEIKYLTAHYYFEKAPLYKPLDSDEHKWDLKKAKDISNLILEKHVGTDGEKLAKNLLLRLNEKKLSLTTESVLEPNQPNRCLVSYKNVKQVYFKIFKTNYFQSNELERKHSEKELKNKILNLPLEAQFNQALPVDEDYNSHNVEVKLPNLNYGYYYLIACHDETFDEKKCTYQKFHVSNLSLINQNKKNNSIDCYVLHRTTGKPIKEAKLQVWFNRYNYNTNSYEFVKGKEFVTDENGFSNIKGEVVNNYNSNFMVEIKSGNDVLFNGRNFYSYNDNYDYNNARNETKFFTDRAIYRPGQTVYFKALLLNINKKESAKILPNKSITITLYDVNGQKVSDLKLTSNDYGTVNGAFTLPQGLLTGQMYLSDGENTHYFSVEEYKRPKFETYFDTLRGSYKINEEVIVKGIAKAYAGNVVDGAKVKYRVVRSTSFPTWWYWCRPYYYNQGSEVEITNGELKTNEKGEYEIKFKALPNPKDKASDNPTYDYNLIADVTDINGETQSTTTNFRVGYTAITLNISVEQILEQNKKLKCGITASNLNGVPENANGKLIIYSLKQPNKVFRDRLWVQADKYLYTKDEYYKLFPNDLYADETNKYKWEKDKEVYSKPFDTKSQKEIDLSDLKKCTPGIYLFEATCKDKFGNDIKDIQYVTIYNTNLNQLPEKTAQWSMGLKTYCEPNDTAQFVYASSYTDLHVFYDLTGENENQKTIYNPSLKLNQFVINEKHRGGLAANFYFVKNGRFYTHQEYITVPFSNKELNIEYSTFRNKLLPGEKEKWRLIIKNKKGDKVAAEMLAAMYDASLDKFKANYWDLSLYNSYYNYQGWENNLAEVQNSRNFDYENPNYILIDDVRYDELNMFGFGSFYSYGYPGDGYSFRGGDVHTEEAEKKAMPSKEMVQFSAPVMKDEALYAASSNGSTLTKASNQLQQSFSWSTNKGDTDKTGGELKNGEGKPNNPSSVIPRKNFNETAFFFPTLQTNENGELVISFTMPESLTKWKFMALAHTKDLVVGKTEKDVITQKELMVQPNAPRFLRENDELIFVSKISNLSKNAITGVAELQLFDALTDKPVSNIIIDNSTRNFSIPAGQSTPISFKLAIPETLQALKYKVVAKAGQFSDGEEQVVPVLTNRMLVTESLPLPIRFNQTKEFTFTKFINQNNKSTTLKNHAYTLEFTANPVWYAIQSLPYLMEYPYECSEQTFSRYYANALASHVVNSKPKIKQVFDLWKQTNSESLLSNLEKNQELKAVLLEETPWVLCSKNETENKKRVALLFDLNKMSNELQSAFNKLKQNQTVNGGWPWFKNCPEDWYITQHIITGFAHLKKLGVIKESDNYEVDAMINNGIRFCDNQLAKQYRDLKKYDKDFKKNNHLDYMAIQYLYLRSYYPNQPMSKDLKEAIDYYLAQAKTFWLSNTRYMQAMLSLALNRFNDKTTASGILKSLKQNAIVSEEMGMYWKDNNGGYYWYQAPIETQALMIEAFDEIANDTKTVDDLKTWLIKNKQTQNWSTTKATTEAVYALMLRGTDWLSSEPNVEITMGGNVLNPATDKSLKADAGTGYFKKTYTGSDIKTDMGKIKVVKKDAGVSYGSVYWQYFEQLDKITPSATPLQLTKKLFVVKPSKSGPVMQPIDAGAPLKVGDKVRIRIELRCDRNLEYVHLKDMRASGFEPTNVLSSYKYQDGLGYYEATKDASTNFFISYLPKGTFVFEYDVFVSHSGNFSNGITSIQCMYAPEFTSNSEGVRVKVE